MEQMHEARLQFISTENQFNLMMYPVFEFDLTIFALSFLASELTSRRLRSCYFVINGKKEIRLHHAYIGALLAFIAGLVGQVMLLNVGLGTMFNDILYHLKKRLIKSS